MTEEFTVKLQKDVKALSESTLSEMLDREVSRKQKKVVDKEVANVRDVLSKTKIDLGDGKIITPLEMTGEQLKARGDIFEAALVKSPEGKKLSESARRTLVLRLDTVFKGSGLGSPLIQKIMEEHMGEEAFETATKMSLRRARESVEELPIEIYQKVPAIIKKLEGESKHLLAMAFLGGWRAADFKDLNIENISFTTGKATKKLKGKEKAFVFSSAQLDVLKELKGDRTSGPLFKNVNKAQTKINNILSAVLPKIDTITGEGIVKEDNFTYYNLRNANETLHAEIETPENVRDIATGRKAKTEALGYIAKKSNRIKVTNAGNKVNAMAAGYSGRTSLKQLMHDMGYTNTSTKTNLVKVTKDILIDEDYIMMLDEAFYKSLPGTYGSFNKSPDVNPAITQATDELGTELIGLSKETVKGQRLDKKAENIKKEEKLKSKKKKGKINTENPVIQNIMKGAGVSEEEVQDMNFKDLYDKYKANLKSGGQEFRADDIGTPRVTSYGAAVEAAAPDFLDFVTDPETLKTAGKVAANVVGGIPGKVLKTGKLILGNPVKNVADRPIEDPTGVQAELMEEGRQQRIQEQMADIESKMVNVPEENIVPETTEERTQRRMSELGF